MTAYDVLNEATIAATPADVVAALMEEAAGRSQWWQPFLLMRQRGDKPLPEIGAVVDVTVNGEGWLGQRLGSAHLFERVAVFDPDRRLVLECFEGDFRGTEEWTLDPVDAGHTRIATRWRTDPQGMLRLMARFVDVPGSYSKVIQEGFRGIERFTAKRRGESGAGYRPDEKRKNRRLAAPEPLRDRERLVPLSRSTPRCRPSARTRRSPGRRRPQAGLRHPQPVRTPGPEKGQVMPGAGRSGAGRCLGRPGMVR